MPHSDSAPQAAPLTSRLLLLAAALLLLSGCALRASRPDLERLYADIDDNPAQPPVILIHGLAGSTLVDRDTGKQHWPGSLGDMTFGNYRELARVKSASGEQPQLVPGELFTGLPGVDYYAGLIDSLERIGRFRRGEPGQPVGDDRRRYYLLVYDWRRDNLDAVRQLHQLIEQIRHDYDDPSLRVDVIAHSNGGLVAEYYRRFGPRDVLDGGPITPWDEGGLRIRRLLRLGTPQLGSVTSLERLLVGMRVALRTVPVEVLATFATPFFALPAPDSDAVVDAAGQPVTVDLFDPALWRAQQWSVFAPEVVARVTASAASAEDGQHRVRELQAMFERHLRRAGRLQSALALHVPAGGSELAVFGGDCTDTPARAVLETDGDKLRLVFAAGDLRQRVPDIDYKRLFIAPGDGLVTRQSQLGRSEHTREAQIFFLCEAHSRLTVNPYFQNNLLYYLLLR